MDHTLFRRRLLVQSTERLQIVKFHKNSTFLSRCCRPISLGCGHTVCKLCLVKLPQRKCPFDQSLITRNLEDLPVNFALLQLVGVAVPEEPIASPELTDHAEWYLSAKRSIEELAILLKPVSVSPGMLLT